jgi:hypothetical protein
MTEICRLQIQIIHSSLIAVYKVIETISVEGILEWVSQQPSLPRKVRYCIYRQQHNFMHTVNL